ncbi:MAG: GTPase Era [Bacteroidota bacterium]
MNNTPAKDTFAGFVAIIGKPNAGKSTFMNSVLNEKLSIVTPKPQTTRKRVLGIYTKDNLQIVFVDTPGFIKPRYALHEAMMEYVTEEVLSSDVLLVLFDVSEYSAHKEPFHSTFFELLGKSPAPKILLLNKIDLLKDKKAMLPAIDYFAKTDTFSEILPISAYQPDDVAKAIEIIAKYIPKSPFYYDEDLLSTQNERFFVSELIREQIFLICEEEIPYSTEVSIVEFKEREKGKWYINAEIIVERPTQKPIIIGKDGQRIKQIGELARVAIENHLGTPVYLDLFVKVRPKWRQNPRQLKSFGY